MEKEVWKEGKDVEWTEKDDEQRYRDKLVWKERHNASTNLWNILGLACLALTVIFPAGLPIWLIVIFIAMHKTSFKINPYDELGDNPTYLKRSGRISEAKSRAKDSYGIDDPKHIS